MPLTESRRASGSPQRKYRCHTLLQWRPRTALAFSTGNEGLPPEPRSYKESVQIRMLRNSAMNPLFQAVVEATEEAIVNALVSARSMTGRDGITAHRLPHDRLRAMFTP